MRYLRRFSILHPRPAGKSVPPRSCGHSGAAGGRHPPVQGRATGARRVLLGGGSLPRGGPGRATGPRAAPESPRAARPVVSRLSASLPRAAARAIGARARGGARGARRSGRARGGYRILGPLPGVGQLRVDPRRYNRGGVPSSIINIIRGPWVGRGRSRWAVLSAALSIASLCFVQAHQMPPTVSGQPLRRWAL